MTEVNVALDTLKPKLDEVVEATLQVAPNRSEAYFALMLLFANVTKP